MTIVEASAALAAAGRAFADAGLQAGRIEQAEAFAAEAA